MNKKRILITGSKGFIGKNLVEYLSVFKDKYLLYYPPHSELELLDSAKVAKFISKNNINQIVHCASVGGSRKTGYDAQGGSVVYKNLRMFFNLAENLGPKRRMIFLGSGSEYDFRSYRPKMKEDYFDTHIPEDAYGFSKFACSKYIEKSQNIINLRLFGVYGKYEDFAFRFISNSIVKNLLGLPIVVNQNVFFDFLYIDDLVKIIEYFILHKAKHKFYNVSTGKRIDLVTIARKINKISPKVSPIIIRNKGMNREYSANNSRLLKELKEFSFTAPDEALEELYLWYNGIINTINKQNIAKDEYFSFCRIKARRDKEVGA